MPGNLDGGLQRILDAILTVAGAPFTVPAANRMRADLAVPIPDPAPTDEDILSSMIQTQWFTPPSGVARAPEPPMEPPPDRTRSPWARPPEPEMEPVPRKNVGAPMVQPREPHPAEELAPVHARAQQSNGAGLRRGPAQTGAPTGSNRMSGPVSPEIQAGMQHWGGAYPAQVSSAMREQELRRLLLMQRQGLISPQQQQLSALQAMGQSNNRFNQSPAGQAWMGQGGQALGQQEQGGGALQAILARLLQESF